MRKYEEIQEIYESFGDQITTNWAISKPCHSFIVEVLGGGKTILELGSGLGTEILCETHKVISIEEDSTFIGRHPSKYIHAPLKNLEDKVLEKYKPATSWYDPEIINKELNGEEPMEYDLILVDGPAYGGGRGGFYEYLHLFDTSKIIMFDDIERKDDKRIFDMVVEKLGRPTKILEGGGNTLTGVILTEEFKHLKD
jgi:hypothetical protein|tara:strand:+ start:2058 stop:2648 length:591 start_codon:yes stop_codon:yes gene_type:complete